MRPLQIITLLAGLSAAWPGQGLFEDSAAKAVQGIEGIERLFKRQNDNTASTSTTQGSSATSGTTTDKTSATSSGSSSAKVTGSNTAKVTGSNSAAASASGSGTITGSAAASTSDVDPRDAPAGVSMMTPNALTGAQYYKVGDWVTFGFNFTSMINKPSAVNVLASCSSASAQWTLAANLTYQPSMEILWDTNQYQSKQTPQLVMATYTLIVENANEAKATAVTHAGELGMESPLTFGMYLPQPYVPYSDFNCPTCSGAISSLQQQTVGFLVGMASITILSFTWFATGRFGVF